jgi:hypothetical protein
MSTEGPTPKSWVSEYLIPIGTILIAILALLAPHGLPTNSEQVGTNPVTFQLYAKK